MKKNKNNKKIKFKIGNNLMLWVLIVMGLIFFFQTFDLSSSDEVTYDQYRRYLENQQIQKIIYTQDQKVEFFLNDGKTKHWVGLTINQEKEKQDWLEKNIPHTEEPRQGMGVMDVVFSLAPWLLILFQVDFV